jgi:cytochrome c2
MSFKNRDNTTFYNTPMKKILLSVALSVLVGATIGAASFNNLARNSDGKSIFKHKKCDKCHTVESQDIERSGAKPPGKLPPDLSGVGLKHDADWIKAWLLKEKEQNGKKHLKKWTGSDDDLDTISKWLADLKKTEL